MTAEVLTRRYWGALCLADRTIGGPDIAAIQECHGTLGSDTSVPWDSW